MPLPTIYFNSKKGPPGIVQLKQIASVLSIVIKIKLRFIHYIPSVKRVALVDPAAVSEPLRFSSHSIEIISCLPEGKIAYQINLLKLHSIIKLTGKLDYIPAHSSVFTNINQTKLAVPIISICFSADCPAVYLKLPVVAVLNYQPKLCRQFLDHKLKHQLDGNPLQIRLRSSAAQAADLAADPNQLPSTAPAGPAKPEPFRCNYLLQPQSGSNQSQRILVGKPVVPLISCPDNTLIFS